MTDEAPVTAREFDLLRALTEKGFEDMGRRLDNLSVVHADAYAADQRTIATQITELKGNLASLRRWGYWLAGSCVTIVAAILAVKLK